MKKAKEIEYQNVILKVCESFIKNQRLPIEMIDDIRHADEEQLFAFISEHKLGPISYAVLKQEEALSDIPVIDRLNRRSYNVLKRNSNLIREANEIKSVFIEKGISIQDYKGSSFTKIFYTDLGFRKSIDVDFAIKSNDLKAVKGLMIGLKYREAKANANIEKKNNRARYLDYPFVKDNPNGPKFLAEFHIAPAHKALYVPVDFDEWNFSDDKVFSAVDQAFFVIIHHGAVDLWGKLLHLIDLNQILTTLKNEELEELLMLCDRYRVRKFFDLGVKLMTDLFNTKILIDQKYTFRSSMIDKIKMVIVDSKLKGNWSENTIKVKYHLKMRDSFSDKIKSLASLSRFMLYRKTGF